MIQTMVTWYETAEQLPNKGEDVYGYYVSDGWGPAVDSFHYDSDGDWRGVDDVSVAAPEYWARASELKTQLEGR